MFHRIWGRLKSPKEDLSLLQDLLANEQLREDLLGFRVAFPPSDEKVLSDTHKAIRYTESSDYQIWAKEAWSHVMGSLDGIVNSKTPYERDFNTGRLVQTLKLLSISYKARAMRPALEAKVRAKKPVPSKNGN